MSQAGEDAYNRSDETEGHEPIMVDTDKASRGGGLRA